MGKKVYYRLELFLKHLHRGLLNLFYNRNVSNKIDKSYVGIKLKSTYKPPFYPKSGDINSIYNYLELKCSQNHETWKRL